MIPFQLIWKDLKSLFHRKRLVDMDEKTVQSLHHLAEVEQTSPSELLGSLLENAIQSKEQDAYAMRCWERLSERERQVTALICAGYSTDQIAVRICIAPSTVKTHVKKIFVKYQVHERGELRKLLAGYDLSMFE